MALKQGRCNEFRKMLKENQMKVGSIGFHLMTTTLKMMEIPF